jgi:hypothetical protein
MNSEQILLNQKSKSKLNTILILESEEASHEFEVSDLAFILKVVF